MGYVLLILGLLLWCAAHFLRSVAPDLRAQMQDQFGLGSKIMLYAVAILGIVVMVIGYRTAPVILVWTPPAFLTHLNNLLVLIALYMYFITATRPGAAFVMGNLKNPQLTGFKLWAVAHLLVNGDLAAIILFAGLLAWAVAQMILGKRVPSLVDRAQAPITNPWVHLGFTIVAYALIAGIHLFLGVSPFPT